MDETRTAISDGSFVGALLSGRYEIRSKLGEGGMASVYLAVDQKLSRQVVVKVPRADLLAYPGFRERFSQEIGNLAQLQHPNIARIQDLGEHDGVPFAVLDYLAGGDLKLLIANAGGTLSSEQVVEWLPPVCRGLDFVHSQGTIHRDVKPQNVLFDERGQVFLSDFGIATTMRDLDATASGSGQLTVVGGFVGSSNYAPPEAIHRILTPAYDQYSLAVTVYFALSGSYPIRPSTTNEATLAANSHEARARINVSAQPASSTTGSKSFRP